MSSSRTILMTCWAGRQAPQDLLAQGFLPDPGLEVLDDLIIDVGFEEGQADHLERLGHVLFGDLSLAPEELQHLLEAAGELVEHRVASLWGHGPQPS